MNTYWYQKSLLLSISIVNKPYSIKIITLMSKTHYYLCTNIVKSYTTKWVTLYNIPYFPPSVRQKMADIKINWLKNNNHSQSNQKINKIAWPWKIFTSFLHFWPSKGNDITGITRLIVFGSLKVIDNMNVTFAQKLRTFVGIDQY